MSEDVFWCEKCKEDKPRSYLGHEKPYLCKACNILMNALVSEWCSNKYEILLVRRFE